MILGVFVGFVLVVFHFPNDCPLFFKETIKNETNKKTERKQ